MPRGQRLEGDDDAHSPLFAAKKFDRDDLAAMRGAIPDDLDLDLAFACAELAPPGPTHSFPPSSHPCAGQSTAPR